MDFPEEGPLHGTQMAQGLLSCSFAGDASTVDVRDQPWGLNPELLKSLFSLCLKWEQEPVDAGHEQLGVERAACLERGLGQPQQMFTHQYMEQLSENQACVGAHAALGTLEEGRSHPCAPFHLSLSGFLHQPLPRAAHPDPIPALSIPLTRQEPRDLPCYRLSLSA